MHYKAHQLIMLLCIFNIHYVNTGTQKSTTPQKPKEEIDNDKKKPSHPIPNL